MLVLEVAIAVFLGAVLFHYRKNLASLLGVGILIGFIILIFCGLGFLVYQIIDNFLPNFPFKKVFSFIGIWICLIGINLGFREIGKKYKFFNEARAEITAPLTLIISFFIVGLLDSKRSNSNIEFWAIVIVLWIVDILVTIGFTPSFLLTGDKVMRLLINNRYDIELDQIDKHALKNAYIKYSKKNNISESELKNILLGRSKSRENIAEINQILSEFISSLDENNIKEKADSEKIKKILDQINRKSVSTSSVTDIEKIHTQEDPYSESENLNNQIKERIKSAKLKKLDTKFLEVWIKTRNMPDWIKQSKDWMPPGDILSAERISYEKYDLQTSWGSFIIDVLNHSHVGKLMREKRELSLQYNGSLVFSIMIQNRYSEEEINDDDRLFWVQDYSWEVFDVTGYVPGDWEEKFDMLHTAIEIHDKKRELEINKKIEERLVSEKKKKFGL